MKNNNYAKLALLIVLIVVAIFTCKSLNKKESDIKQGSLDYLDEDYNFIIEFPESWMDEYNIEKTKLGLNISSKMNEIELLAHINVYSKSQWENIEVSYDIMGENDKYIVAVLYPGDVNYNINSEKSTRRYKEMINDLKTRNCKLKWIN